MNEQIKTTVLDAGGRYGLHPTWKPFKGELDYYLFEPDEKESSRLKEKYKHRSDEIKIYPSGLSENGGEYTLNLFKNKAMSSTNVRNPISSLFLGERLQEVEIIDTIKFPTTSIDSFASSQNLKVDFLKLDTEGTEFNILKGAEYQLGNHVIGIRVEVAFDFIFEGMPLFGTIHDFLLNHNFILLNLDYDGKGDYQFEQINVNKRYGILTSTDAVYVKRPSLVLSNKNENKDLEVTLMKYASFCFLNEAPDLALRMLQEGRKIGADYSTMKDSKLYRYLSVLLHKHFYGIKWQPGQSLKSNEKIYFEIMNEKMKVLNEYMESIELNPD